MAKKIKVGALLTKDKHLDRCPLGTVIIDEWGQDVLHKAWGYLDDDGVDDGVAWWRTGDNNPHVFGMDGASPSVDTPYRVLHVGQD